jgi:signal transduction histidine kinase
VVHTGSAGEAREPSPELIERSIAVILAQGIAGRPPALFMGALFGVLVVPHAGWLPFLAWYGAFAAGILARQPYFRWLLARYGSNARTLRLMAVGAAMSGWMVTISVPVFSPYLHANDVGVLTIILMIWVTLGVTSLGVQPRVYIGYTLTSLLTIYVGWARHASHEDMLVLGVALMVGAPIMVRLARTLDGQVREIVEAVQDKARVVEQLREALVKQQETQRARSRFLGAASHDLRQPVQALLFLSDIFRKSTDPARRDAMAQQIVRTGQSIDGMFRHLVDFAQIDAGTMKAVVQPVQLERLIASASSGFGEKCAARGLRFRTEVRGTCTVSADPVLLERMLRNFLDNAFKYSLQGEIVVLADCTGPEAVLTVSDQGVGMDPDDLAQACNAFYRGRSAAKAEAEGIGLGLAISNHMADLMQSALEIGSQPGQGTCVTIRLPRTQQPACARTVAATEAGIKPLQGMLIGVVENDRLARDALISWLEEAGARVAAGGSLARLEEALAAEGEAPDFLLADYRLGEGTGVEAVEAIRRRFGPVPAVIVSGEPEIRDRGLPLPVLQKPVTPDLLLATMQANRVVRPPPATVAASA